jgi:ATP-dependent helicase/DNAse subunit B
LFVSGAAAGTFPEKIPDTDIITMQDISNMEIQIDPTPKLQTLRQNLHAQNIVAAATHGVWLCRAEIDKGQKTQISPLARGLKSEIDTEIYHPEYAKSLVLSAIGSGSALKNHETAEFFKSVETAANINIQIPKLFTAPKPLTAIAPTLSVTEIENFVKCPYYRFVTNCLNLSNPRPQNTIDPRTVGTILHAFLEDFLKTHRNPKTIIRALLKPHKLPKYVQTVIENHAIMLSKNVESDSAKTDFRPKFFEKRVETTVENTKIRGIVDRIDENPAGETIVVDYKSGGAGLVRLQVPFYAHLSGAIGGYYLNLRDLSRREITPEDIPAAAETVKNAVVCIKNGDISQNPVHKSVCEYCLNKTFCGGKK